MKQLLEIENPPRGAKIENPRPVVKDTWFRADLEANSLIPLTFGAKTFLTAEALTRDPDFDAKEFALSELNIGQLSHIKTAMDRTHAAFDIPSRSTATGIFNISDETLHEHWNKTRGFALYQMIAFATIIPQKKIDVHIDKYGYLNHSHIYPTEEFEELGEVLNQIVRIHGLQPKLHAIFASGVDALKSEKGRLMTRKYREQHSNKRIHITEQSYNGSGIFPMTFQSFLRESICQAHPDLAEKISLNTIIF